MQIKLKTSLMGITAVAAIFLTVSAKQASAQVVSLDFSSLGTVYQDTTTGDLYNTSSAGRSDVTAFFESDALAAAQYWNNTISIPGWSETINFTLADLSSESAVADSAIDGTDANGRPILSSIRYDIGTNPTNGVAAFIDPTPLDNSEFTLNSESTTLGGGTVNVGRFGNVSATAPALASIGYDVLTVDLHEIEHSMGYNDGLPRFVSLVGAATAPGTTDRQLTVPTSLTGLPSAFNIPIVPASGHIDGVVDGGVFNDTIVAEPGFNVGQRALPTDIEIYGLGTIEGATADQIHLGANGSSPVPEASTTVSFGLLLSLGMGGMVFAAKKKAASQAV